MPTVESATSPDLAVHEPEALPPVTQQNDEALGAVALATELVRPYNSNEQMVVDRRTGSRLTRQQFAELNSDPHTRL